MNDTVLPHSHGQDIESHMDRMPATEDFETLADIFKQLGDSSRIKIFWLLCHCEECVINISALVDMTSPAVSHHLARLKASGLITNRREGKEVYYKAADTECAQLLHLTIEKLAEVACLIPENGGTVSETIKKVHALITENMDKRFTIEELSHKFLLNTTTLKAAFKERYGLPIASYMKKYRMEQARKMLAETNISISDIAHRVGYETQSKFSEVFKSFSGMLPSEYRSSVKRP